MSKGTRALRLEREQRRRQQAEQGAKQGQPKPTDQVVDTRERNDALKTAVVISSTPS
ncbi:MAG TPA: hypothetical protein VGR45_06705 [Stellaceae bacterium]|nr:hypothetical protein [Stellaceae bacterium]